MGAADILIGFALFAAGALFTAGYGAVSVTPADFKKARICFYLAALCAGGAVVVWGLTAVQPLWARLFVACITGVVIVGGLTEGLRWLERRQDGSASKTDVEAQSAVVPGILAITKTSEIPATKVPTQIRYQFVGGKRSPTSTRMENILQWYVLWGPEVTLREFGGQNHPAGEVQFPTSWAIFLVFDKPVLGEQLIVEPASAAFPRTEVKQFTPYYALITTFGDDPPAGFLDIYVKN
jgi:hypothetical protein